MFTTIMGLEGRRVYREDQDVVMSVDRQNINGDNKMILELRFTGLVLSGTMDFLY